MSDDVIKKNISKNIGKYREVAGLSQKELAKKLDVVPSRISNWETGANCPTIDMLFKVCKILNVSINDIYGVYPDSKFVLKYEEQEHIKKYRDLSDHGKEMVDMVLDKEWQHSKKSSAPAAPVRYINYYYRLASAGTGQIVFDYPPTDLIQIPDIPEYKKVAYAIGVNGRSMEPLYQDGDILLVEMTDSIERGEIGIFMINGESFVKKLGETELISLNTECRNVPLVQETRCMGRVIDSIKLA